MTITNGHLSRHIKEKDMKLKRLLVYVVSDVLSAAIQTSSMRDKRLNTIRFNIKNHKESLSSRNFWRLYRVIKSHFKKFSALVKAKFKTNILCARGHNPSVFLMVRLCVLLRIPAGASYWDIIWPYGISLPKFLSRFSQNASSAGWSTTNDLFPSN